eukprot:TRINITY_DN1122_c3_g1_i1.p3 TRINITY_DN1122_c3_g1~~TRINITY_DN1122_c3_g1_i1.p3  ORF type:complete len:115 (-),score=19.95 TRINITY_DN1122_c3_g1_i1:698-1042(-)
MRCSTTIRCSHRRAAKGCRRMKVVTKFRAREQHEAAPGVREKSEEYLELDHHGDDPAAAEAVPDEEASEHESEPAASLTGKKSTRHDAKAWGKAGSFPVVPADLDELKQQNIDF